MKISARREEDLRKITCLIGTSEKGKINYKPTVVGKIALERQAMQFNSGVAWIFFLYRCKTDRTNVIATNFV